MDSGIFGYRVCVIPPKLRGQNDNIFTRCFFTLLIPEIKKNPTSFHSIFCPTPYYSALHLFFLYLDVIIRPAVATGFDKGTEVKKSCALL